MSNQPWSFGEAYQASKGAEQEQRRVESEVSQAYKEYARAKKLAAVALARRIWELKADGIAVTACETLAKGDPRVAELIEERDSKEGLKETAKVAAWRVNADRRDMGDFIGWSMRRDLAEYCGPSEPAPVHMKTFGGQ